MTKHSVTEGGKMANEKDISILRRIYTQTAGKAWEPKGGTYLPFFERAIAAGYVRRVDGRCGFERLKDAMIQFTEAGHAALATKEQG